MPKLWGTGDDPAGHAIVTTTSTTTTSFPSSDVTPTTSLPNEEREQH